MSSGRAFQTAMRYASIFRPLSRSGSGSALSSFARGSVRVAGTCSPSAWFPQALQMQRSFPSVAQPTYGFAAQGISSGSTDTESNSISGSSGTSAVAGSDDGECLPSADSEGVLGHRKKAAKCGPPWPHTAQPPPWHQTQHTYPHSLLSSPPHPGFRTTCSGVTLPRSPAPWPLGHVLAGGNLCVRPQSATLHYGTQAVEVRAAVPDEPSYRHPSRPGHGVPTPHQPEGGSGRLSAKEFRRAHSIEVDDPQCPEPFQSFSDTPFPQSIMDVLHAARYTHPSSIQAQAWPIAAAGRDLVAIASTGSGKTMGFLLPALLHIQAKGGDPARGPSALVLAPTRELAKQIEAEANRFRDVPLGAAQQENRPLGRGRHHNDRRSGNGLRTVCLYGGASRMGQLQELRRQPHLIIATPGRLMDFLDAGEIDLRQVSYLVLDEADRMLDMGFEPQINEIARSLPAQRQTLFFSATWPSEVRQAAARFATREPVHLFIGNVQAKPVAATTIKQRVQIVEGPDKLRALETYLRTMMSGAGGGVEQGKRAMVFCQTKAGCDNLAYKINSTMPFQAASLHGDKSQAARDYALEKFRSGRVPVLVATDVAARGLDIPNVTAVVNYDMPNDIEMYVHRIGRTGRAGAAGDALTLLTRRDGGLASALVGVLEEAKQEVPAELRQLAASSRGGERRGGFSRGGYGRGGGFGGGGRSWGGGGGGGGFGRGRGSGGEERERYGDRGSKQGGGGRRTAHEDD